MQVYNYLFYKIYSILSVFDESPSFASIMVMCWLFMFNSFTILFYASKIVNVTKLLENYVTVGGGAFVIGGHLFYFYYKGKYLRIIGKYKDERKNVSIIGFIVAFSYIFFSIWIFWQFVIPYAGGILK